MLVLASQPDPLKPHELGKPTEFVIENDSYYVDRGVRPRVNVGFPDGANSNGGSVLILNRSFRADGAQPFSPEGFDYSPGGEQAAQNFANAIRSNPDFRDFAVSVIQDGIWVVRLVYRDEFEFDAAEWMFDGSGVSPSLSITPSNGRPVVTDESRLWYEFWSESDPVSERKYAAFDGAGQVRVNMETVGGQLVTATDPSLSWDRPVRDDRMTDRLYMKFGTFVTGPDCRPIFGQSYETPEVVMINAITQPIAYSGIRPYVPEYELPLRWLSRRSDPVYVPFNPNNPFAQTFPSVNMCRSEYGWIAIYCGLSSIVRVPEYVFRIQYYDDTGAALGDPIDHTVLQAGVYRYPFGPANPIHDGRIATASSYSIQVAYIGFGVAGGLSYGARINVRLTGCNCNDQQLYFLEDLGSWRTLKFEQVESVSADVRAVEIETPRQYRQPGRNNPSDEVYLQGGRQSITSFSDEVITLRSAKIRPGEAELYREFLRSPRVLTLVERPDRRLVVLDTEPIKALRPVIIERGSFETNKRGEVVRLNVTLRYNLSNTVRP